jgi:beta-lactamase class A
MKKIKYICCRLVLLSFSLISVSLQATATVTQISIERKLAALENSSGGRIGLAAVNTGNNQRIQYRANESFPMQCTDKVIGVAVILKKSMQDKQLLQERIYYKKSDLTGWDPITEKHLAEGMTVVELCRAAISYSDNAAMNLLAKKIGGPAGINTFARSIGDTHFKLDHTWPEEALANPASSDDSSTPFAMNESVSKLVLGNILASSQRKILVSSLKGNTTGDHRIRAGVPKNWIVADKTGTGAYGATNDTAVIWSPKCPPIVITIFYSSNKKDALHREDVLASATRIVINDYAKTDQCIKQSLGGASK